MMSVVAKLYNKYQPLIWTNCSSIVQLATSTVFFGISSHQTLSQFAQGYLCLIYFYDSTHLEIDLNDLSSGISYTTH